MYSGLNALLFSSALFAASINIYYFVTMNYFDHLSILSLIFYFWGVALFMYNYDLILIDIVTNHNKKV